MTRLREVLLQGGLSEVRTLRQSGNVVVESELAGQALGASCRELIRRELGLEVGVVTRTVAELAAVVDGDPFAGVATDPRRYQVSFLSQPPAAGTQERLAQRCAAGERVLVREREIYAWHPHGIARSPLWEEAARIGRGRGESLVATARNWSTVTALLALGQAG
jgi:uncharacterized protein (DUF1697 family)